MKLHETLPFDSNLIDTNDLFKRLNNGRYYINSDKILTEDNIISYGSKYMLVKNIKNDLQIFNVQFMFARCDSVQLAILFWDIELNNIITIIDDDITNDRNKDWFLIDWDYMQSLKKKAEVINYCSC